MATKNIEMYQKNEDGGYDKIVPNTVAGDNSCFLTEETAALYGFDNNAIPDDIFIALFVGTGRYGYKIRVQYPDGTPIPNAIISGIDPVSGRDLKTNSKGETFGTSSSKTVSINVQSPVIDVQSASSVSISSTGAVTKYTITLQYITKEVIISNSKTYMHSPHVENMDFSVFGAGGGGGGCSLKEITSSNAHYYNGGGGGGGGYVSSKFRVLPSSSNQFIANVGAGGQGGTSTSGSINDSNGKPGGKGGTTSIIIDGKIVIQAEGGNGGYSYKGQTVIGGSGNGNGGSGGFQDQDASDGTPGTGYAFNDAKKGRAGGGGGGGSGGGTGDPGANGTAGGSPNGGKGNTKNSAPAPGGISGGGGGGGANLYATARYSGANGGNGVAYVIFHHKGG